MLLSDNYAPTTDQRQIQLGDTHIKGEASQGGEDIVFVHPQLARHEGQQVHNRAVRNLHALRTSG